MALNPESRKIKPSAIICFNQKYGTKYKLNRFISNPLEIPRILKIHENSSKMGNVCSAMCNQSDEDKDDKETFISSKLSLSLKSQEMSADELVRRARRPPTPRVPKKVSIKQPNQPKETLKVKKPKKRPKKGSFDIADFQIAKTPPATPTNDDGIQGQQYEENDDENQISPSQNQNVAIPPHISPDRFLLDSPEDERLKDTDSNSKDKYLNLQPIEASMTSLIELDDEIEDLNNIIEDEEDDDDDEDDDEIVEPGESPLEIIKKATIQQMSHHPIPSISPEKSRRRNLNELRISTDKKFKSSGIMEALNRPYPASALLRPSKKEKTPSKSPHKHFNKKWIKKMRKRRFSEQAKTAINFISSSSSMPPPPSSTPNLQGLLYQNTLASLENATKGSTQTGPQSDYKLKKNKIRKPIESPYYRARKRIVKPSDFEFIKYLGKSAIGKLALVRKKQEEGRQYTMKIIRKEEIILKFYFSQIIENLKVFLEIDHPFIARFHDVFYDHNYLSLCLCETAGKIFDHHFSFFSRFWDFE